MFSVLLRDNIKPENVLLQQDLARTERSQWYTHTHLRRLTGTY